MSWVPSTFWLIYAISFPVLWYHSKYQFQPGWTRPSILNRGNDVIYQFGNLIVFLIATAGLWYSYGFIAATIAFGVRLVFSTLLTRVYYNRALGIEIARNLGILEHGSPLDNPETIAEAVVLARHTIMCSMRGDDYSIPNSGPLEEMRLREKDFAYVPTIKEIHLAISLRDELRYEDVPPKDDSLRREQYIARFWDRLTFTNHKESK
jgi:hypothetical protein